MEDFSKYIGAIIILAITIYRAFTNFKSQQKSKTVSTERAEDAFEEQMLEQFDFEESRDVQFETSSPSMSKQKVRFSDSSKKAAKPVLMEEEDDEENDLSEILEDFDARKAFIYSEIFKPPYL